MPTGPWINAADLVDRVRTAGCHPVRTPSPNARSPCYRRLRTGRHGGSRPPQYADEEIGLIAVIFHAWGEN